MYRNTGPAIALTALQALEQVTDSEAEPILLELAADHLIENQVAFQFSVNQLLADAEAGQLVTFGIVPTAAQTGYGYIKRGLSQSETTFKVYSF